MSENENIGINNTEDLFVAKIKVLGVGGAGNNAVNRMIEKGVMSAEFFAINTDRQALKLSKVPLENRLQIGEESTKGLGAGSIPKLGETACEENREEIERICEGTDLLFIAAGMGGGTGTGAAPVIAKIAKEKGCLTVAVVTLPFAFEGKKRDVNASEGVANLSKYVDTIIIIPNDKLLEALPVDTPMAEALAYADDNLRQGVCGITDLISIPALINLDFADVRTIMANQGLAHMGVGRAKGENRIIEAVRQAVSSPLLETTIEGASGVIVNITGGNDLTIGQVYEAAKIVQNIIDESANVIFGANINPEIKEEVIITLIATGFSKKEGEEENSNGEEKETVVRPFFRSTGTDPDTLKRAEESLRNETMNKSTGSSRIDAALDAANYEHMQKIAESRAAQNAQYNENYNARPFSEVRDEAPMSDDFNRRYTEVRRDIPAVNRNVDDDLIENEQHKHEMPAFVKKLFGKKDN